MSKSNHSFKNRIIHRTMINANRRLIEHFLQVVHKRTVNKLLILHQNTIQSKLYSSQILSALLGTKRAAVVRGDTMSELSCSPLKVRLKRNLIHGSFTATRLLFKPVQTDHLTNSFPLSFN